MKFFRKATPPMNSVIIVGERLHGRECQAVLPVGDNEFSVLIGNRIIQIQPPPGSLPGHSLRFVLPRRLPKVNLVKTGPNVTPIYDQHQQERRNIHTGTRARILSRRRRRRSPLDLTGYYVDLPDGTRPGKRFPVVIQSRLLLVTCPPGVTDRVRILPPPISEESSERTCIAMCIPSTDADTIPFTTPDGVRMTVPRPPGVQPGQFITFSVPVVPPAPSSRRNKNCSQNSCSWKRIERNRKYAWVPVQQSQQANSVEDPTEVSESCSSSSISLSADSLSVDTTTTTATAIATDELDHHPSFHPDTSALVRQLLPCTRPSSLSLSSQATLSLVPTDTACMEYFPSSSFSSSSAPYPNHGVDALWASTQRVRDRLQTVHDKATWLRETCRMLQTVNTTTTSSSSGGGVCFKIRRHKLHYLDDSIRAVAALHASRHFRAPWVVQDEKGNAMPWNEWLSNVAGLILDQYFVHKHHQNCGNEDDEDGNNHGAWDIKNDDNNKSQEQSDALRVLGRLMGKALHDGVQLLPENRRLVSYLYKQILGLPMTCADLERLVPGVKMSTSTCCVTQDPSTTQAQTAELLNDGTNTPTITPPENRNLCTEAYLRYCVFDRIQNQLKELLLGIFDVIPERLLTILDVADLDFLVSGLPTNNNRSDCRSETQYYFLRGNVPASQRAVQWFWELVNKMSREQTARLWLFVTGNPASSQPLRIRTVPRSVFPYPRAEVHESRLDLPLYETKDELATKLERAVAASGTGADIRRLADATDDLDSLYGHLRENPSKLCQAELRAFLFR